MNKEFCNLFGGEKAEQYNALMTALWYSAGGRENGDIYKFLEETPKTTLVYEIVQSLHSIGYEITEIQ